MLGDDRKRVDSAEEGQPDHAILGLRVRSWSALKWASVGELLSRAASPLSLIVLARFLSPREYGVFVAAVLVVSFCQTVIESGVVRSLIQKKGEIESVASSAFWLVLCVAAGLSAVVFAGAKLLNSALTSIEEGAAVIAVLGLQVPIIAAGAVHKALLERELRFRPIFVARLTYVFASVAVSLPLAISGFGAWSLVCGALLGSALESIVLWATSRFRPKLGVSRADLRSVASFSAWTLGQDVLAWFVVYADAIIVAAVLSADRLGTYRLGSVLVVGLFAAAFVPAERVLFSYFSKFPDKESIRERLCVLLSIGSLIAPALGFALLALESDIERLIFPSQWIGIGTVIAIIGLREAIANIAFAVDPAYKGLGRPDVVFKVRAVNLTLLISAQALALSYGFEAFLVTRLVVTGVALALILIVVRRFFGSCNGLWNARMRAAGAWLTLASLLIVAGVMFEWDLARFAGLATLIVPFSITAFRAIGDAVRQRL